MWAENMKEIYKRIVDEQYGIIQKLIPLNTYYTSDVFIYSAIGSASPEICGIIGYGKTAEAAKNKAVEQYLARYFAQEMYIKQVYIGISSNIIRRNLEDKIVIEGEKVISVLEKIEGYDRDIDEDIWDLKISMLLEQQKRLINCSSEYLSIIFNYIHVNNNRLGITPYEEIYVALLVQYLQKNDKEYCV